VALLECRELGFAFGEAKPLFSNVNFSLNTGEMVVILGGNAAGKTTLLRMMAGLLRPTSGHIAIKSDNGESRPGDVAMVFQNPDHQMIAATVEEEIALGMELRGVPAAEIRLRVDELIEKLKLGELRTRSPETLSGGQKQRVAIAAVLANDPLFVLFDEPDSLLDVPSRRDLMQTVELIRSQCGLVWTTPHPARMPHANRYYLLMDGSLRERSRKQLMELLN
jgi:energy-coupling factor transport system ATP-binding protein